MNANRLLMRFLGLVAMLSCLGTSAGATPVTLGGVDLLSSYTAPSGPNPGILTFQDTPTTPGLVDDAGGITGLDVGDNVWFEAALSDFRCNGTTPFNAATNDIKQACFISSGTPAFRITEAGTGILLLQLDLVKMKVGREVADNTIPTDTDGFINFGDFTAGSNQSVLTVTGGSLAAAVGGIGSEAHLNIRMDTILPGLVTTSDPVGYFNSNFTAGNGIASAQVVWDLTIVPIPEPGTGALVAFALVALSLGRRRPRAR